jgi:serpin B
MHQRIQAKYWSGDDYEAVALPLASSTPDVEFVAFLPLESEFEAWVTTLDDETMQQLITSKPKGFGEVELTMPKFNLEYELPLTERLKSWGMVKAFDKEQSDFSPLSGDRGLYVGDTFHSAKLSVDEEGVEAAASTAIAVPVSDSLTVPPLRLDRPFVFFIRDIATNTVLFVGHCVDPR